MTMMSRQKVWDLLNDTYGLDSEGPKSAEDFEFTHKETHYFHVEFMEPIECELSMSVTYDLSGEVESWSKNCFDVRAFLPVGVMPELTEDHLSEGYFSGKGNSNYSIGKKLSLELLETEFWAALDDIGDTAIDFILASRK